MKLSRHEQETIINFNEEEDTASVYTHNNRLCEKLLRLSKQYPDKIRVERKESGAASFTVPKSCISVREPYSDARRAADSRRAKEAKIRPPDRSIHSQNA
ncbi:MAG: immunoglobulin [Oscillospiraceae bacterium]|nr:immunoglobulin [Oscillospiraceae bacterium]